MKTTEEALSYLRNITRSIPDYPKPGIIFRDLTTIFQDKRAMALSLDLMISILKDGSGKILEFDRSKYKMDVEYEVDVEGELSLHGETSNISATATLKFADNNIMAKTSFDVSVDDYKIKIPKAVIDNISESISVSVDLNLEPYSK